MMNLSATHAVSVNPTTGEVVSSLPWASEREVDAAIALAAAGYRQWRQTPLADRADALRRIGAALRARGEEVAQMITLEMGKPIAQARGEVAKSANLCDWYAEHGPAMLVTTPICYLEDLFVDPAFRGQGIARTMIKSLQSEGADKGWSRLYWHTRRDNPARHLYDEFTLADDYVRYRITLES